MPESDTQQTIDTWIRLLKPALDALPSYQRLIVLQQNRTMRHATRLVAEMLEILYFAPQPDTPEQILAWRDRANDFAESIDKI